MQMWLYPYCEDLLGGFKFYLASNDEHSDYIKKNSKHSVELAITPNMFLSIGSVLHPPSTRVTAGGRNKPEPRRSGRSRCGFRSL